MKSAILGPSGPACYYKIAIMRDSLQPLTRDRGYCLKPGYSSREAVTYFVDRLTESEGILHQPDVYPFVANILRATGGNTILDLGCGRAQKLVTMCPEFDLIGIDFGENLEWCRTHYPFGRWAEHDFDRGPLCAPSDWNLDGAAVICSDMIEHLIHPEPLLETVADWVERAAFALFSTPERDLVRGLEDMGPPPNPHHVREWNLDEFRELLLNSGMDLWTSGLTVNNDRDWQKRTIVAIARKSGWKAPPPADDFRVLAIICAYNEADVIEHTLEYLTRQGIRVILIDNWSTDGTDHKARQFLDKGLLRIETYPRDGPSETYDWHNLLSRVEEVASEAETDWVLHHDADEIRESPWRDLNLREALYQVDQEGYNCVNHACIIFHPTAESEAAENGFPDAFRYFEFGKRPGHFAQMKVWKKQPGRVCLANSGGHDVTFPGRRVYPLRFLLRHYPIRSQEHGLRKVFEERLGRFNLKERNERGWHTQYDAFRQHHTFLRDPRDLILFDTDRFDAEYLTERLAAIGVVR